jgi:hypothetical protein
MDHGDPDPPLEAVVKEVDASTWQFITMVYHHRHVLATTRYKINEDDSSEIEHSCMGKFRDMGNPAQAAKPRVQDFFLPRVQDFPCPYIRPYRKDIPL